MIASRSGGFSRSSADLVAFEILGADRRLERRRRLVLEPFRQAADLGPPLVVPDDIANAIHHRAPKIGLQRALMTGFEGLEMAHRGDDRVLHDVRGVVQAASRLRQPAVRPAPKRRYTPLQQPVEGLRVALFRELEELDGRFRRQRLIAGPR